MTAPRVFADNTLMEAAALAFAMVRFQEGSAHADRESVPSEAPRPGVDAYVFFPSLRRVPRDEVEAFLLDYLRQRFSPRRQCADLSHSRWLANWVESDWRAPDTS
jgi:hypothetical protein